MYNTILRHIRESKTIIIHRHSRPDGDALGSQIGLKEAIKATFPNKKVYAVGDMVARYAFMGEDEKQDINYYSDCLEGMCYCHSFTEIAYKNNSGGVLNSALVSISLRESHDDIIKDKSFFTRPKNHNFKSSVIPVSFILSHFFNEMTKELISYQNNLEEEVKRIHDENSNLSLHIVKTLAATIDAKDRYTNGHSERVAEYSKKIAKRYGYNKKQLNEIYMALVSNRVDNTYIT